MVWDVVLAAFIFPGLKFVFNEAKPAERISAVGGFIEDKPVTAIENDSFKRNVVAKEISRLISITPNQQSFAIGILGEYGSGKTSFINLINLHLPESSETIYFNPWRAEHAPNIQRDFFDLLASHLHDINPKLPAMVLNYSRKLSRVDSAAEMLINKLGFLNSLYKTENYTDDYKRINQLIKESGKKIVVTIDDLDRLYSNEIIEVLTLIRNTASFGNVFYLVAYEKQYVLESIKSLNANASHNFLDKIIQLEIPLPKRESEDLLQILEVHMQGVLSAVDMHQFKEKVIPYGFKNSFDFAYKTVFRHSRDVIKFVNAFNISYKLLKNEVLFENLFVLELVKFRYPLIYDLFYDKREDYLQLSLGRSKHQEIYELSTFKLGEKDELELVRLLDENYSKSDINLIRSLANNLFRSNRRDAEGKHSIVHPNYFERYFRYRLSGSDVSEVAFRAAIGKGMQGLRGFIDECVVGKTHKELVTRLLLEKPENRSQYELITEGLFYLGGEYVKLEGPRSFSYQDLIDTIWDYEGLVSKKYYKGDVPAFSKFLLKLFDSAAFPYLFNSELIYHVKYENREIAIPFNKLSDLQVIYFCEYVRLKGLDENAMYLLWATVENHKIPVHDQPGAYHKALRFEPGIILFLKEFIKSYDPLSFLRTSMESNIRDNNMVMIRRQILDVFDTRTEFRDLIAENVHVNADVREEYLEFFDECQLKDFNEYINFEFKTVLKPVRNDS